MIAEEEYNLSELTYQRRNWLAATKSSSYTASYDQYLDYTEKPPIAPESGTFSPIDKINLDVCYQTIKKLEADHAAALDELKKKHAEIIHLRLKEKLDTDATKRQHTANEDEFEKKLNAQRLQHFKNLAAQNGLTAFFPDKNAITQFIEQRELEEFWDNFENRQCAAFIIACLYGGLQGWGMAGFVLSLVKDAELGAEVELAIAILVAAPVTIVNMWLVRPDLEKYIGFQKYKEVLNGTISGKALFITVVSSILLGGVVAYGITSSLPTKDTAVIAPAFGFITAILAFAEGLLNIGSLDDILKTSFNQKLENLRSEYHEEDKKAKATLAFYTVFITSCVGMIGIALVGTKTLSNQLLGDDDPLNMAIACVALLLATSTQLPFYQDRALTITKRWIPVDKAEAPLDNPVKPVFNTEAWGRQPFQKGLWAANGILNAPCAYLGVVTTLGKFLGLDKMKSSLDAQGNTTSFDHHNTFEQIFFQYGNSIEASIIYGIGTLFFLAAVGISMAANSVPPQMMEDPANDKAAADKKKTKCWNII